MALTRPRIGQLNTNVFADADPITVLHAGATAANVDVGFLMNRANGLVSNVALYWSESGNTFVTAFTSNTGITDSNISATSYTTITTGHHLPGANVTYSLGSTTQRWKDLWLSGTTIYLGGATISSPDANTVAITNQNGGSFSVTGSAAGQASGTFGNLIANSGVASTSTLTGALQVTGGAGISGNVYIGGNTNITGTVTTTGNILPSANLTYNLGSLTQQWKSIYVGPGTLYVNGKPVIQDNSGTITLSTTPGQNLQMSTTGSGIIQLNGNADGQGGYIAVQSTLQISSASQITSSDGNAIKFGNEIAVDNIIAKDPNTNLYLNQNGTGSVQVIGPLIVTGATSQQGILTVSNTAASTNTTTGALQVAGGAGIVGSVYAGSVYTDNFKYANGAAFVSTTLANTTDITANLTSGQNVGLSLTATGVAAGNYGSATSIPTIVVDAKGRITSLTSNAVSTTINLSGTSGTGSVAGGGTLTFAGSNGITATISGSTVTIADTLWQQANANLGTATNNISTLQANVGAFEIYANANIGTQFNNLNTLTANVGAFHQPFSANLGAFETFANTAISSLYTNANANTAAYLNTSTGVYITNLSSGNTRIVGGYADNFPVGANTKASGAFTTLIATGTTTLTGGVDATNTSSGQLQVTGGVGITGNLWVGGNVYTGNLIATTTNQLVVSDPLVYFQNPSPSPYNFDVGFYSDFVGGPVNAYGHTGVVRQQSGNAWVFFSNVKSEPTATNINWNDAGIIYDAIKAGNLVLANATVSTSTNTGALIVAGGAGIQGALWLTNTNDVSANIGTISTSINSINANLGSYENTTNANIGTIFNTVNSINANLGLYENTTNANLGTATTNINSINANVGSYYAFANANLSTQTTNFNTLTANVGSYENTTNANIGAQFNNFNTLNANVGAYQIWANANVASHQTAINSLYTNANANTAAYLTTATINTTGNITGGNITSAGTVTVGNLVVTGNASLTNLTSGNTNINVTPGIFYVNIGGVSVMQVTSAGLIMGAPISMGGFGISGLATPTNTSDAATKAYADGAATTSAVPNGDLGTLGGSAQTDAFGQSTTPYTVYDMLSSPTGSILTVDYENTSSGSNYVAKNPI